MPKKLKKKEVTLEEIVTVTHLKKYRMETNLRHERRMARDLKRLIGSWHKDRLPKEVVVGFSAFYMVNFIFDCCTPEDANHLLVTAISRELIHTQDIKDTETIIQ